MFDCLDKWNRVINRILDICNNVIAWGGGFNNFNTQIENKILFEKFKLLNVRDYKHPSGFNYLPCPSCMMPELDVSSFIQEPVGVISHKNNIISDFCFPHITNRSNIYDILEFIRTFETIITNSYHAYYWSTLLAKKVILYKECSEKFSYLRYPPVHYTGDIQEDMRKAKVYKTALIETRFETLCFAEKIFNILKERKNDNILHS